MRWSLDAFAKVKRCECFTTARRSQIFRSRCFTDEAPLYERADGCASLKSQVSSFKSERTKSKDPKYQRSEDQSSKSKERNDQNESLLKLLASPNLASKQWVFRQYDHMVRTNTAVLPGADAAVVRIKETRRALAMSLDGNGRYCAANPREGAKLIVAEAARNVVCVGARPIAITNCLNFASPERPEVMWSFSEVIDGMAEACTHLQHAGRLGQRFLLQRN